MGESAKSTVHRARAGFARLGGLPTAVSGCRFQGVVSRGWFPGRGFQGVSAAVIGENDLRGLRATDSDGQVTITTIFPTRGSGRWRHIHFEVYASLALATSVSHVAKASQIALPQSACDAVFATTGYSTRVSKLSRITLASDNDFSDGAALQLPTIIGSVAAG